MVRPSLRLKSARRSRGINNVVGPSSLVVGKSEAARLGGLFIFKIELQEMDSDSHRVQDQSGDLALTA